MNKRHKWKAKRWFDEYSNQEYYSIERTHPIYGFPAVEVHSSPRFATFAEYEKYAEFLNGEDEEQLKLF